MKKRIIAFLLGMLIMLSCFTACQPNENADQGSQNESASGEAVSENSEISEISEDSQNAESSESSEVSEPEEVIVPSELYAEGVKKLGEFNNFGLSVEHEIIRESGFAKTVETNDSQYKVLSYGEEGVKVFSKSKKKLAGNDAEIEELFFDGTVYQTFNGVKFKSEIDSEDYHVPVILFDAQLYEEITVKESSEEGEVVISFASPKKIEEWLAAEYASVSQFKGETVLDEQGRIVENSCEATYNQGIAEMTIEIKVEVEYYEESELPEIEVPKEDGYRQLDMIQIPEILTLSMGALENMKVFEFDTTYAFYGEISGYYQEHNEKIKYFDDGDYHLITNDVKTDVYTQDGEENYKTEVKLDGNNYTITSGDKTETRVLNNAELKTINHNCIESVMSKPFMDESYIDSAIISAIDGYITIVITGNKLFDEHLRYNWCEYLYKDGNYLESLGAEYSPVMAEYVITIDIDTYLPVAINCDYEGSYLYNGKEYELSYEKISSFTIGSSETYYNIQGEAYPDIEPTDEDKPTPVFYKVTGANGETLYLLGTIHVGDDRTAFLPQEIRDAFNASDAVAFEMNVFEVVDNIENYPDLIEALAKGMYYTDGTTVDEHISEEIYSFMCLYMATLGIGGYGDYLSSYTDILKPSHIASIIEDCYEHHGMGLHLSKGVEARLYSWAKEKSLPIYEVEDRLESVGMTSKYSDELNELLLAATLSCGRNEYVSETQKLYELWCDGDLEKLREGLAEEEPGDLTEEEQKLYDEYNNILLGDRDKVMLDKAKEYLSSGETVFMAVGAAHVLGEDSGLVKALEEEGYTVELVEYK